jgi:hypothetical protein
MAIEITNVESMQWNRTITVPPNRLNSAGVRQAESELDGYRYPPRSADAAQISPEILAEVQAAISAEVAKMAASS